MKASFESAAECPASLAKRRLVVRSLSQNQRISCSLQIPLELFNPAIDPVPLRSFGDEVLLGILQSTRLLQLPQFLVMHCP